MKIIDVNAETMLPLTDEERAAYYSRKNKRAFLKKIAVTTAVTAAAIFVVKKLDSLENDENIETSTEN